ncbi:MAG: hypothetical protein C0618_03600 [Desulfuromonas sp.]|nr:MAG: hypothetical protein C0618_03600 [Desulfuromonas sp.]
MADDDRTLPDQTQVQQLQSVLTAQQEELFQLVLSRDDRVLSLLLKNPHLTEDHLLALLKRRDLSEALLSSIYRRHKGNLSNRLIRALAKNPVTPGAIMRNLLPHLLLFELLDFCFMPGVTADQRIAAERTILQRLPTTPLGSKMTLARRGTAAVVGTILKEGDPKLVEICLNSPRLAEAAVFQFINGPRAAASTLSMIARNGRWKNRPNLQLAILKNRLTPTIWFNLWIPTLPVRTINQLLANRRLAPAQRKAIQDELSRRKTSH